MRLNVTKSLFDPFSAFYFAQDLEIDFFFHLSLGIPYFRNKSKLCFLQLFPSKVQSFLFVELYVTWFVTFIVLLNEDLAINVFGHKIIFSCFLHCILSTRPNCTKMSAIVLRERWEAGGMEGGRDGRREGWKGLSPVIA